MEIFLCVGIVIVSIVAVCYMLMYHFLSKELLTLMFELRKLSIFLEEEKCKNRSINP